MKEEFIGEVKESEDDTDRKITGKGVNNYKGKDSAVKLFPSLGEQAASAPTPEEKRQIELKKRMLQKKMMLQKQAMQMQKQGKLALNYSEEHDQVRYCPKCDKDETREECKYGGEYWDENSKPAKAEDPRGMKTKVDMVRNKLRAMGLKMSHVPEGEMVEGLSVDDQMKISREYNRKSPEEKREANKRAMGVIKKVKREKDTRTDAQKMTDATGPRPGSRYRGD